MSTVFRAEVRQCFNNSHSPTLDTQSESKDQKKNGITLLNVFKIVLYAIVCLGIPILVINDN